MEQLAGALLAHRDNQFVGSACAQKQQDFIESVLFYRLDEDLLMCGDPITMLTLQ